MERCEHCGDRWSHVILIEMAPGHDGKPWWLCRRCWADGLPTRVEVVTELHEGVSVLPSTGDRFEWKGTRTTYEVAKSTAAPDFDRMAEGGAKPRPKKRSTR